MRSSKSQPSLVGAPGCAPGRISPQLFESCAASNYAMPPNNVGLFPTVSTFFILPCRLAMLRARAVLEIFSAHSTKKCVLCDTDEQYRSVEQLLGQLATHYLTHSICSRGAASETRTRMHYARDFKQKLLFLDYLITFNVTWSGSGRSSLLLRRLTSQVVSTPSLDLSKAWIALRALNTLAEFNHLFDIHFCIKGTRLYQLSLVSANSTMAAYCSLCFYYTEG